MSEISKSEIDSLAQRAWEVRENARVLGETKVGCSLLSSDGRTFVGSNVEHRFRSHDIHAEVNSIGSMVSAGGVQIRAIYIAAQRELFTPCGACLDWIFEFGGPECLVYCQQNESSPPKKYRAADLMPYYPR